METSIFIVLAAFVCFSSPAKVFVRNYTTSTAKFEVYKDRRLFSPSVMSATTKESCSMDCAFSCLGLPWCFSYNFKKTSDDNNGMHICEVLSSDKYNSSQDFKPDQEFDHFSIKNPCSEGPCMNGGTCIALYYTDDFKCKCPPEFEGKNCDIAIPKDCYDLYNAGSTSSGVYSFDPDGQGTFSVYCDMTTDGGGWTVFQRRQDGSQDFYLGWSQYKAGFGQLSGNFWLGNDKINRLTASKPSELRVELRDWSGGSVYAKYSSFAVGDESLLYKLTVGSYSGTAGDSLTYHNDMAFTTKDSDNDPWSGNCAVDWTGAWWYKHCFYSNLNGQYLGNVVDGKGIRWYHYKSNSLSMKFAEMKLRRAN